MRIIFKPLYLFFLFLIIISLHCCKSSRHKISAYKAGENKEANAPRESIDTIPEITVDNTINPDSFGARFSIDTVVSARFPGNGNNDILEIRVKYSGGCREHDFKLVSDKRYMKSMPPQLKLVLVHNNNQDHCRNLISRTLYFNISEIKYESQKKLLLLINDYPYKIEYLY